MEVQIWTNIVLETKIPALVIVAFLLGLVPMWLIHRGTKWRLKRRIAGLESAARANATAAATTPVVTEPVAPTRPGDGVETENTSSMTTSSTATTDDESAVTAEPDTAPTRPDNP